VKVKISGVGPLSYVSVDHAGHGNHHKLGPGDSITVDFKEKLQIFGSPFDPIRCNVILTIEEASP